LAEHLVLVGNCRAAVPHFQRVLATFPQLATYPLFGVLRLRLAACLEKLGDLEAAELQYREVFRGNLGDRRLAQVLAAVCEKRGDWHCVADTLREFLDASREGSRDASAWLALGNALLRSGRPVEAEAAYRRSLELKEWPVVHFNLAGALVNLGRLTAATEQYRAAEQGGMRSEEVYVDWAATEERAGRHAVARQIAARGLIWYPASAPLQRLARR
jgi:tetratricopeptide (TPR) repeat protein